MKKYPIVFHLSLEDFGIVIDRCERIHVQINGIEGQNALQSQSSAWIASQEGQVNLQLNV